MIWQIEIVIFILLIAAASVALRVRDLLAAIVALSVYSFGMALLLAAFGAVDVGFMEAVVGAGVTGILFLIGLYHTTRKSID